MSDDVKRQVSFADLKGQTLEKVQEFDQQAPPNTIRRRKSSRLRILELDQGDNAPIRIIRRPLAPVGSPIARRAPAPPLLRRLCGRTMSAPTALNERGRAWEVQFKLTNLDGPKLISPEAPVHLSFMRYEPEQVQLTGSISVLNIAFEKHVFVRHSFDGWATFSDRDAYFSWKENRRGHNSQPDQVEQFVFQIPIEPDKIAEGTRIEFVIGYRVDDHTHWDSNNGQNYRVLATAADSRDPQPQPQTLARDTSLRISRDELQDALKLSEVDLDFILGGSGDELSESCDDLELVLGSSLAELAVQDQNFAKVDSMLGISGLDKLARSPLKKRAQTLFPAQLRQRGGTAVFDDDDDLGVDADEEDSEDGGLMM